MGTRRDENGAVWICQHCHVFNNSHGRKTCRNCNRDHEAGSRDRGDEAYRRSNDHSGRRHEARAIPSGAPGRDSRGETCATNELPAYDSSVVKWIRGIFDQGRDDELLRDLGKKIDSRKTKKYYDYEAKKYRENIKKELFEQNI